MAVRRESADREERLDTLVSQTFKTRSCGRSVLEPRATSRRKAGLLIGRLLLCSCRREARYCWGDQT